MVNLNNTILFSATNGAQPPPRDALCRSLCFRYGGNEANWSTAEVSGGFLVRIPEWITQDEIEGDADFWEHTHQLILLPWQTLNRADSLPLATLADITIHNFPIAFWHPFYFRQAVAAMGALTGISELCLRGLQKSKLRLRIQCSDLNLIPYTLFVGHGNQWSKCKIDLRGRPDQADDHHPPPQPPSPDVDSLAEDGRSGNRPHLLQPPYIPSSRRAQPEVASLAAAPLRGGIPVAHTGLQVQRSTGILPTPRALVNHSPQGPMDRYPFAQRQGGQESELPCHNSEQRGYSQSSHHQHGDSSKRDYSTTQRATGITPIAQQPRMFYPGSPYHEKNYQIGDTCPSAAHHMSNENKKFYTSQQVADTCPLLYPSYSAQEKLKGGNLNSSLNLTAPCNPSFINSQSPLQSRLSFTCSTPLSHNSLQLYKDQTGVMANISQEDEALIQRFVGLSTGDSPTTLIKLPQSAVTSTDWECSLLVKIVTDRTVIDNTFASNMLIAWKVDPTTVFRPVMRNLYLVEFISQQDMYAVTLGGPWSYRGDLVAFRKVTSQADLHPEHIGFANLWVQFFNLPVNSLTEEGLDILANELGTRVSPPVDGFVNGTRFTKLKSWLLLRSL